MQQMLKDPEVMSIIRSAQADQGPPEHASKPAKDVSSPLSAVGKGTMNYDFLESEADEDSSVENLALQLFEGEEMNADMANFIGIHMLNEIFDPANNPDELSLSLGGDQIQKKEAPANYVCPDTGAHFEYNDIVKRIKLLQQRRSVIDRAIEEGE